MTATTIERRAEPRPKPRPASISRIRNYFLTGLVVAGPVAVTLWLIWWFVTWVDNLVRPFIPIVVPAGNLSAGQYSGPRPDHRLCRADAARLPHRQPGRPQAGRFRREACLSRMPIVRPIYRTAKQIFETLFSKSESSFRRVGLVEFPVARHVVAGVSDAIAERGDFRAAAGGPSTSRPSCRARRTRPPASSSMCRGAT